MKTVLLEYFCYTVLNVIVVVLVAPAWVTYHSQVTLTGKKSIVIQTTYEDGWKLTPHSLAQAVERQAQPYENKLVIFTNPGNPSGQVYTAEELRELAEVFRKYKMIVVSDEIYSYSTYDDTDYVSLSKYFNNHEACAEYMKHCTRILHAVSLFCSR
ncbi:hypothetical protein EB796_005787 [Bugula neritina]|uniref:Aminotransferase class I/classII large domain-containing protein n=1 Tax=Bugula neritina TaxID=10212 RepID=A0A7J7KDF9_BUGNE|nr:hypothetical protein EB796_005787 [Bugula neritina]